MINLRKEIEACFNDNKPYAKAWAERSSGGYVHLHVELHWPRTTTSAPCTLTVFGQSGYEKSEGHVKGVYAIRLKLAGFNHEAHELAGLENAVKIMRRIKRKMPDESLNSWGVTFKDYALNVLKAANITCLMYEPRTFASGDSWVNKGFVKGFESIERQLQEMETTVLNVTNPQQAVTA